MPNKFKSKKIKVKDKFQKYEYELVEPIGKNFDPEFRPDLTPKQMLKMGIYGGVYFSGGGEKEFPKEWFTGAKISESGKYENDKNFFKVRASQPLKIWQGKGWIDSKGRDPRGWIQWYFRYYYGRRISDEDTRQIKRWKAIRRHLAQIQKNCRARDFHCRPVQRQAVLHWAYDSRKI
jgi:hypothetical protein